MSILTEEEIFVAAIDKPLLERASFLDQACGGDDSLRAQVEALLAAHDHPNSLLEMPARTTTIQPPCQLTETAGTIIGPYKLLQQIGEGGMGVVYMAEQNKPVERLVALKIIRPGMDTRRVIARFEAERQALAMMDHPNIARVLDAGATDSGRPYFVMELVRGVPITQYCDARRVPPKQRLELFLPVLQAVQHAHQKGIIHRDIKPSNVLVAEYDDRPVPKVIDFGVAKATSQKLTEKTLFTEYGQLVGTLDYMSPEQARLNQMDVDTRSDIYSLGVLLYELLTGDTPFDRLRLRSAAFEEMMRIIREEEPPRPSTRLSDSGMLASVSANRSTEPGKLSTLVRGELDWIVMKALDKDRNRRYETANGFAADVQRYLDNEPVQACPPSAAYRLQKFVRRNKAALATFTVTGSVLVAATLISTWQAVRATQALQSEAAARHDADAARAKEAAQRTIADHRRAEADEQRAEADHQRQQAEANLRKAREAVDQMLTRVSENRLVHVPQMELVRHDLLKDALRFYEEFSHHASADPEVQLETARCYRRMGHIRYQLSRQDVQVILDYHKSIDILESLVSTAPANKSECESELAESYMILGHLHNWHDRNYGEAETCYTMALALRERLAAERPESFEVRNEIAEILRPLATALRNNGRPAEAEQVLRESLNIARSLVADSPASSTSFLYALAASHYHLGQHLAQMKQTAEAEKELRETVRLVERLVDVHPNKEWFRETLGEALGHLAVLLHESDRAVESEAVYRQSIACYERLAADFPHFPEHRRRLAIARFRLGQALSTCHRPDEAEQLYRQALESSENVVTAAADDPLWSILNGSQDELSALMTTNSRSDEIENLHRQSIALGKRLVLQFPERGDLLIRFLQSNERLAELLTQAERQSDAEQVLLRALEFVDQREMPLSDDDAVQSILSLRLAHAQTQARLGRWDKAQAAASQAAELGTSAAEPLMAYAVWCRELGQRHAAKNNLKSATAAFQQAVRVTQELSAQSPLVPEYVCELASCQTHLGNVLARQGQQTESERACRQALDVWEQLLAAVPDAAVDQHEMAATHFALARVQWASGRTQDAEDQFERGLSIEARMAHETTLSPEQTLNRAGRYLELGHARAAAGHAAQAEQAYRRCMAITELVPEAWEHLGGAVNNLGAFLAATGQYAEAEQLFRRSLELQQKVLERTPERTYSRQELAGTYFNLGLLLQATGRPAEAEQALTQALSLTQRLVSEVSADDARRPYPGVARVHDGLNSTLIPGRPLLHAVLANLLDRLADLAEKRGEPVEAQRMLEQAIDNHQSALETPLANPHYRRFLLHHYAGTIQHVVRSHHAGDAQPESKVSERSLPDVWEDYYRAAGALAGCASDIPIDAEVSEVEADMWSQARTEQEKEVLRQVFRRSGRHPETPLEQNNLSWLLVTHPVLEVRDLPRAIELARQAVAAAPEQAHAWNTLGVALSRAGDWNAAIESLEKAESLAPGKYRAFNGFFLAMAHWQLGDKDQARQQFDESVAWMQRHQPENSELLRFRQEAAELLDVAEATNETEKR